MQDPKAPPWQVSHWLNTDQPLSLEHFKGRVVLLHAFQMLCRGCVSHAVPQAERIHKILGGEGLVVVGLHTVFEHHAAMTRVALEAFVHEYRLTHPIGIDQAVEGDTTPATMRAYGMRGTPSLLLYDRKGRLRLHEMGGIDDLQLGWTLGSLMAESA